MPKKATEKFLEEMRERYRIASEHWEPAQQRFKANMRMYAPEYDANGASTQWSDDARTRRKGRPILTIPMLTQPINQIVGDARQNRIGPRLSPVDERSDKDTAEVFEGIIRAIEYNSRAHIAYEYALEMAAACGFGFVKYSWDYDGYKTLKRKFLIERVPNPMTILLDPYAMDSACSDMEYAFDAKLWPKEVFKRKWPGKEVVSADFADSEYYSDWLTDDSILVAEYWAKEHGEEEKLLRLNDGTEIPAKFWERLKAEMKGLTVHSDRTYRSCKIWQYITNGVEWLEDPTEWPDNEWIPIVPVWGKELWVEGKRQFRAVIEDSHDAQRYLNYLVSKTAENIALSPLAPYIAAKGQTESNPEWQTANVETHSVLVYDPVDVQGKPAGPPQRNQFEPAVAAMSQLTQQAMEFIRVSHGIRDVGFGDDPREHSGKAIQALQREGDTANYHIHDNLIRAVEHGYRIVVRVAPQLMDMGQMVRSVGEDEQEKTVRILTQYMGEEGTFVEYEGKNGPKVGTLDAGAFDTRVLTGPAFATKQQESAQQILEAANLLPAVAQMAPDLVIRALGINQGDEIAERIIPPQFKKDENGKPPMAPEDAMKMQQMEQMNQAMQQKIIELEQEKQAKVVENQAKAQIESAKMASSEKETAAKIASDEKIAQLEARMDLIIAQMKVQADMQKAEQQARTQKQLAAHDSFYEVNENEADRRHSSHEGERERQHTSDEGERSRQSAAEEAERNRRAAAEQARQKVQQ